jgi:hypothetical protein
MSLRSPVRNTVLPLLVQERLNRMFAEATGFCGPQMLRFFSGYDINIESYPAKRTPSRKQMFEDCLARFDRKTQLQIVATLLNHSGPFKHGPPAAEDIEFLRDWLIDQGAISDPTRAAPMARDRLAGADHVDPEWDVFVSHASEDKEGFVRPLAEALKDRGLRVWFDEFTLRVGDSLRLCGARSLSLTFVGEQASRCQPWAVLPDTSSPLWRILAASSVPKSTGEPVPPSAARRDCIATIPVAA